MVISTDKIKIIFEWLLSDDTGMSSKAICAWMLDINSDLTSSPSDKWDRGRCIRLLKLMPEWISRLDEMKTMNDSWPEQIELIKEELDN